MRLTLRTLLAYLDGILEPSDAEDLGKKIDESEVATELVHRIRDAIRRSRLGAPGLGDRGSEADANTVAEYLDNTLPPEAVADFEKTCLESDIHLAEVASCHQILALVLGEPAEIQPASRQAMYELKDAAAGKQPAQPKPPVLPMPEAGSPLLNTVTTLDLDIDGDSRQPRYRAKPTVPEYLRESKSPRRWLPVAAAVLSVVCVTFAVLAAFGQFEADSWFGHMLVDWGLRSKPAVNEIAAVPKELRTPTAELTAAPAASAASQLPSESKASEATKTPENQAATAPQKEPGADLGKPATAIVAKEEQKVPPAEAAKGMPSEGPREPRKEQGPEPAKPPTASIVIKPEGPANLPPPPGFEAKAATTVPQETKAVTAVPPETKGADARVKMPDSGTGTAGGSSTAKTGTEEKAPAAKAAAEPNVLPPEPIARLMSVDQVLLKDDGSGGWTRVAARATITPGRILALPTYRTTLSLSTGITVDMLGGTQVELLPGDAQSPPGIRVLYGRAAMMAQDDARLRLAFGNRSGVITFTDAKSVVGVDVRRLHPPGANPEDDPPHMVANLYCATGAIRWDEAAGGGAKKSLPLTKPQRVTFNGDLTSAPAASKELPVWMVEEPLTQLEQRASAVVANSQALPTDRLARLALLELVSRPQKEVRWLALRCLAYIGTYGDLVNALNESARRNDWQDYAEKLRASVDRDAQSAAAVRQALEKQYPDQAATLYRMLWGYSDNDLESGEDAHLVRDMNDDLLAMRRLSFWNLEELTGIKGYRPDDPAARRQVALRRWQQRLDAGEIRLKTPGEKAHAAATDKPAAAEPGK